MISRQDLVDQLARRNLGAWSLVERIQDRATVDDTPARQRRSQRTRLTVIVHHDIPRGRGTARLDIDAGDGSAADLIDQTIALATTTVGPTWTSTPPAAPAKVDLVDPALGEHELGAFALGALAHLRCPDGVTLTATAEVLRERVTITASAGFYASWLATTLSGRARVSAGHHTFTVARRARRSDHFDLDVAIVAAAADLQLLRDAAPAALAPRPGPCSLWLGPDALVPDVPLDPGLAVHRLPDAIDSGALAPGAILDRGLWTLFAEQADAAVERQGLSRYRLHAEIARGAAQLPEPLSITSDGALDFATLSLPVTDDAVAVRRFPIVDRGIAVGLGLSRHEAALRRTDPNGGIRNLVVAPGSWSPAPSSTARTVEIRRLAAIAIDPYTGDASLDIALGLDHRPGASAPIPFVGGTVRLDLIAALARAQRSSQVLRRSAYFGPAAIFIDDAELIA